MQDGKSTNEVTGSGPGRARGWRAVFLVAGILLAVGGSQHPDPDTSLSFEQSTARMLAHPSWTFSHVAALVGFVALTLGLVFLARSKTLGGVAQRIASIGIAAGALVSVEMVVHTLAVIEADELLAGASTPIVNTHLVLAVLTYPAIGLAIAALAFVGSGDRAVTNRVFAVLGILGGVMWAASAPVVVLLKDQNFSWLFMGGIPLSLWMIAVGLSRSPSGRAVLRPADDVVSSAA